MNDRSSVLIKPIDKNVVNQICSGQVILSLATAVKELIENSIDAHATTIKIRLKEYGAEMIEVTDNGCGVEERNFQALTLKHHTSKISEFADVASVETFGFRGEALSSLCSLSKVSIITKHKGSLLGTKLKFDHNGIITESCKLARQTGTTVTLENIFYTLPVRHKEFMRNIRKEFTKMCSVLYAYGILSKGVSISCTNQILSKKFTVMETKGETVKCNITQIFGPKQSQNLLELKKYTPDDADIEEYELKSISHEEVDLEGFISSCTHGCGRSSSDRQFYYINSRPVDIVKVSKLVNDIYHQYNPHQFPFIVLNMKMSMHGVDVNVTPDKRLIFMTNEKLLHCIIKTSLRELFKDIPAVVTYQNIGILENSNPPKSESKENNSTSAAEKLKQFRSTSHSQNDEKKVDKKFNKDLKKMKTTSNPTPSIREIFTNVESPVNVIKEKHVIDVIHTENIEIQIQERNGSSPNYSKEINLANNAVISESVQEPDSVSSKRKTVVKPENDFCFSSPVSAGEINNQAMKRLKTDSGITEEFKNNKRTIILDICMNDIEQNVKNVLTKRRISCHTDDEVKFHSSIIPSQNESAEKELKKELKKESFKKMSIIGQFNLGFIIAKLGPDIFIIDQHATDEKYNFETLQLNTKIQTQKLVIPQNLNLTIEKEELFVHYSDIIRKNGFDFIFDSDERPTNRIKLTSIPMSKNWIFGKEDIDEILFILENAPDGEMCRPSRIRDMFATRACWKSVRIGTALNHSEMRRLIDHMGEIEQPWNCPHGRPTIRHLINLNMIRSDS